MSTEVPRRPQALCQHYVKSTEGPFWKDVSPRSRAGQLAETRDVPFPPCAQHTCGITARGPEQ